MHLLECLAPDAASAQDVCFNSNFNGCGGGQITTPWNYMSRTGVVTGGQFNGTGVFGSATAPTSRCPTATTTAP